MWYFQLRWFSIRTPRYFSFFYVFFTFQSDKMSRIVITEFNMMGLSLLNSALTSKMYVTRANKDYENGQTQHLILPNTRLSPLDSQWNHKHKTQNFGAAAKLMMTSSAVKWAWVRDCTKTNKKKKKLDAFFDFGVVQSNKTSGSWNTKNLFIFAQIYREKITYLPLYDSRNNIFIKDVFHAYN